MESSVRKTTAIAAWALAILASVGSVQAHHSGSMYDPTTPLWVRGTVVGFEDVDPHTITLLEDSSAGGAPRRWRVEGPGRSQLDRASNGVHIPQVGEVIEFCGFPYKSPAELSRLFPGVDFSAMRSVTDDSPRSVWGHVMLTADGEKRMWNPHGVLGECIRSSNEPTQSWLDFLDSNPRARELWCQQRGYAHVRSTPPARELVAEIDNSIADPCE
jgi:hypothetical protein